MWYLSNFLIKLYENLNFTFLGLGIIIIVGSSQCYGVFKIYTSNSVWDSRC